MDGRDRALRESHRRRINVFNIRFMGEYHSDEQLITGKEIPEDAIEFGIVDDLKKEFGKGLLIMLPLFLGMVAMTYLKVKDLNYHLKFDLHFFLAVVLVCVLLTPLTRVHEVIHALCYPKDALKTIWHSKKDGAYFIYCEEIISKTRWLVVLLMPMLLLGVIPFVLWFLLPQLLPMPYDLTFAILCWLLTIMAMGDVANMWHVLKEVPKGADVFNHGLMRSFYIRKK